MLDLSSRSQTRLKLFLAITSSSSPHSRTVKTFIQCLPLSLFLHHSFFFFFAFLSPLSEQHTHSNSHIRSHSLALPACLTVPVKRL